MTSCDASQVSLCMRTTFTHVQFDGSKACNLDVDRGLLQAQRFQMVFADTRPTFLHFIGEVVVVPHAVERILREVELFRCEHETSAMQDDAGIGTWLAANFPHCVLRVANDPCGFDNSPRETRG